MDAWQVVVFVFFVLLPIVLMLDYWGDERCDAQGRPRERAWPKRPEASEAQATHDEMAGASH